MMAAVRRGEKGASGAPAIRPNLPSRHIVRSRDCTFDWAAALIALLTM